MDWPKHSQKYDICTNEEEMYEIVFQVNKQSQKTSENTATMRCFLIFDSSLQKKMKKGHQQAITGRDNQMKPFEFTNEKHQ